MRTSPQLAPRDDDQSPGSGGGPRGLPRRAALRPEIRAAIALEEAGELQEAARVFEYAGEHAQAAILRLEYARTLRDAGERLDVLREGCARNRGDTPEGRRLHRALGDALLDEAHTTEDSARRRSLELEAARALQEADAGARAGELYESLGLLEKAARAYEHSGEVGRLELVLELLERKEQRAASLRRLAQDIDEAIDQGRRRYAHALLTEHVREDRTGQPQLVTRLQDVESKLLRADRVDLGWNDGRITAIRGASRFRIGRAPDAEMSLAGPRLSRYHVELRVDATGPRPRLVAVDLGSKIGSFWQGQPLMPGTPEPIEEPGELALGMAAAIEVHPVATPPSSSDAGAPDVVVGGLVRLPTRSRGPSLPEGDRWMLFLPQGGPLWLAPDIRVPARVLFDRGYVVFDLASRVAARLFDVPLSPGSDIELMIGDRIALEGAPLTMEVLG